MVEIRERQEVDRYVFTDGSVGAASRLDSDDAFTAVIRLGDFSMLRGTLRWECFMPGQKLAVFPCEDVVGHCSYAKALSKCLAQSQHKGRLARTYRSGSCQRTYHHHVQALFLPSNAYCESAILPISALDDGHLASHEATRPI